MMKIGIIFLFVSFLIYGEVEEELFYPEDFIEAVEAIGEEIVEERKPIIVGGKEVKFSSELNYIRVPYKNREIRIFKKETIDGEGEVREVTGEERKESGEDKTVQSKITD